MVVLAEMLQDPTIQGHIIHLVQLCQKAGNGDVAFEADPAADQQQGGRGTKRAGGQQASSGTSKMQRRSSSRKQGPNVVISQATEDAYHAELID